MAASATRPLPEASRLVILLSTLQVLHLAAQMMRRAPSLVSLGGWCSGLLCSRSRAAMAMQSPSIALAVFADVCFCSSSTYAAPGGQCYRQELARRTVGALRAVQFNSIQNPRKSAHERTRRHFSAPHRPQHSGCGRLGLAWVRVPRRLFQPRKGLWAHRDRWCSSLHPLPGWALWPHGSLTGLLVELSR